MSDVEAIVRNLPNHVISIIAGIFLAIIVIILLSILSSLSSQFCKNPSAVSCSILNNGTNAINIAWSLDPLSLEVLALVLAILGAIILLIRRNDSRESSELAI